MLIKWKLVLLLVFLLLLIPPLIALDYATLKTHNTQRSGKGGFWVSCRLKIWLKFGDDLVNLIFKSCRNGEFGKAGDGDFAI